MTRKLVAAIVSATCLAATFAAQAAQAMTVYFNPDAGSTTSGSVEAVLPVSKLGSVPLPRGRFLVRGNYAEISMVPEWQFEHQKVLMGTVLDTHLVKTGTRQSINGIAWFNRGDWLNYYDSPAAIESLTTTAGPLSGRILSVEGDRLVIRTVAGQTAEVPLASINAIHSPRAFSFSIPIGPLQPPVDEEPPSAEANTVFLAPTGGAFHLAALTASVKHQMEDGDVPTRRLVMLGTAISAIQLAQLAPFMALPLYTPSLSHTALRREAAVQSSVFNRFLP